MCHDSALVARPSCSSTRNHSVWLQPWPPCSTACSPPPRRRSIAAWRISAIRSAGRRPRARSASTSSGISTSSTKARARACSSACSGVRVDASATISVVMDPGVRVDGIGARRGTTGTRAAARRRRAAHRARGDRQRAHRAHRHRGGRLRRARALPLRLARRPARGGARALLRARRRPAPGRPGGGPRDGRAAPGRDDRPVPAHRSRAARRLRAVGRAVAAQRPRSGPAAGGRPPLRAPARVVRAGAGRRRRERRAARLRRRRRWPTACWRSSTATASACSPAIRTCRSSARAPRSGRRSRATSASS